MAYEKKTGGYKKYDKDDKYGDKKSGGYDYGDKYTDDFEGDNETGGDGRKNRKFSSGNKKKSCRFTAGEEDIAQISYKNPRFLASFMTEHGKIVPRRVTGNCAAVQRLLTQEIKRARNLALLGNTSIGPNAN
jgi:small subunit ribosomal protein S18